MNKMKFAEAMSMVDDRYYEEAENYQRKDGKRAVNRPLLLVACLVISLALCGFAYMASVYWGSGPTDGASFEELTKPFGTIAGDKNTFTEVEDSAWTRSELISDYSSVYADNSAMYFLNGNIIPSVYFSPAWMVIFAQEDGAGMSLDSGDTVKFDYVLKNKQRLEIEMGYILNGQYYELSTALGNYNETDFQADEAGEYYFCLTNRASTNAVIDSGSITKQ